MKKRFIAAAVPVLVAGSLAAAAPSMSQAAPNGKVDRAEPAAGVAAAPLPPCIGGKQKKALTGGNSGWNQSTSGVVIDGTDLSFRGPAKGKDTVFVTFTATNTFVYDGGDYGRVRVQIDGADMKPANAAAEYFMASNNYASFAGQYCAKVGNGWHDVRVVLESADWDSSGGDIAWLHNPMLNVEVAE